MKTFCRCDCMRWADQIRELTPLPVTSKVGCPFCGEILKLVEASDVGMADIAFAAKDSGYESRTRLTTLEMIYGELDFKYGINEYTSWNAQRYG